MITIDPYKHIPFKEKGRDRNGIDCWGFPYLVHREQLGNELPAYNEGYCTTKDVDEISSMIKTARLTHWEPVAANQAQEGDIVILRIMGEPWHCGLMLDRTRFAHMERTAGLVQESIESMRWAKRIEGFYRWKP